MLTVSTPKVRAISSRLGLLLTAAFAYHSADALDISPTPLYAGGGVKPNLLFMIDDSGSMQDAVVVSQAAASTTELSGMGISQFMVLATSVEDDLDEVILSLDDEKAGYSYVALCPGVNVLAFDPSKTYEPWYGLPDSSFPNARKIPNQPGFGTTNLATARYVEWIDSDNDGVYDFGECGELQHVSETKWGGWGVGWYYDNHVKFDKTRLTSVASLPPEQKRNYANWYTYHRSREYAVKAGLSPVLANLRVRAGMSTIRAHNQAGIQWGLNIADVDDISNPTLAANKTALINELYEIMEHRANDWIGTPLRRTLENAGLYFHLDNSSSPGTPETNFLPDVTTSPILPENEGGACQANHMILVTDGYQYEINGTQNRRFNWGNVDNTAASGGGLYADTLSNTLADIAMYFYDTDASDTLPGKQNVHTHTVSFGVYGTISGFPLTDAEKQWPTDASKLVGTGAYVDNPESLDDVVHAAFNGRGRFMTATDADTLSEQMEDLMQYIGSVRKGTATAISFDKKGVAASTTMFRTLYDMEGWAGKLNAYNFTAATGTVGSEKWEASARLALKDENNPRKIVTFNGALGAPFAAPEDHSAPDTSVRELSSAQLADLLADKPAGVNSAEYLQDMIEYLRGDGDGYTTSPEFRNRSTLGDIVHSSPVFVGAPEAYYPDSFETAAYSDFVSDYQDRTPMVYVGANDGMLHAFNANTGDEIFAYIPQSVFSSANKAGLHWLAAPNYSHIPYVDETPSVGDVFIGGSWRTYLVGALGRGGKSVFVLDVTDPATITTEVDVAANVVVTEFTDTHLGYTFGTPKIAKLEDGEWVAVFGNGYNNDANGKAYLYVLYLDGSGPGGVSHVKVGPLGGNAVGSVANGSCTDPASDCNGLSASTLVDLNNNGKLDRVYAGDLHGNLWAFDFTKDSNGDLVNTNNTNSVAPVIAHQNQNDQPVPFFTACRGAKPQSGYCSNSNRQPITTKPTVVAHPYQYLAATEPNLMVYVGTGQYLSESDVTDTASQSFYGIWDAGSDNGEVRPTQLTGQATTLDVNGNRTMTSVNAVDYLTKADDPNQVGKYGWKLPLPGSGERIIENPSVENDIVLFSTRVASQDLCNRVGQGFIMGVDLMSGGKPSFQVFPDQDADIGIGQLSGGELVRPQGSPPKWYGPDPDDDAIPTGFTVISEPKRAPKRSSWTIMK